jgi:hypothetical protein
MQNYAQTIEQIDIDALIPYARNSRTHSEAQVALIAATKTGRVARLIELDPIYVDVIVRLWQDFTGQQATLEATGQTFEELESERITDGGEQSQPGVNE